MTTTPDTARQLWLADGLLVLHAAFVGFVLFGFVAIWIGWWLGWTWVRRPAFRLAHLAAMGIVAAEAVLGVTCPLTVWEDRLRWMAGGGLRYETSFIQYWLGRILFYDCASWVFTLAYVSFFGLLLVTYWIVPPRWRQNGRRDSEAGHDKQP